jgi:hypothetical protein
VWTSVLPLRSRNLSQVEHETVLCYYIVCQASDEVLEQREVRVCDTGSIACFFIEHTHWNTEQFMSLALRCLEVRPVST